MGGVCSKSPATGHRKRKVIVVFVMLYAFPVIRTPDEVLVPLPSSATGFSQVAPDSPSAIRNGRTGRGSAKLGPEIEDWHSRHGK